MNQDRIELINELTPIQSGMLFHSLLNEGGITYYEQFCYYMKGKIQIEQIKTAWQMVIDKYETFRTDFLWEKVKTPVQVILKKKEAEIYEYDIANLDEIKQKEYIEEFKESDLKKGFDFQKGKLCRLSLVCLSDDKYFVCFTYHHILLDGWSVQAVTRDFFMYYHHLVNKIPLPEIKNGHSYAKYLQWLKKRDQNSGLAFWEKYLQDVEQPTFLLQYTASEKGQVIQNSSEYKLEIHDKKSDLINEFCKNHKITANSLMQVAWGILLQKYNNTNISCAGMTVSGRPAGVSGMENMVGLFINTLPVVIQSSHKVTIANLLQKVNRELAEVNEFSYLALPDIQKVSNISSERELFNSVIVFENFPKGEIMNQVTLDFEIEFDSIFELTNYDLTIVVANRDRLQVHFMYNDKLFTSGEMSTIAKQFLKILEVAIQHPELPVTEIDILTEKEREYLFSLKGLEQMELDGKPIDLLFEEIVEQMPDKTALVFQNQTMTYQELNQKANQLAWLLHEKGVGPNQIIGIMTERSLEMIICMLGILKAGGTYLPLDHENPPERIRFFLQDSNVKLLLTQSHLAEQISHSCEKIFLDEKTIFTGKDINLPSLSCSNNLAYVIYTSGSSGKPKGVMLEHSGIENLQQVINRDLGIQSDDRIIQFASSSFDASVLEIYMALLTGATLYVVTKDVIRDHEKFMEYLNYHQITVAVLPPIYLNYLDPKRVHTLRHLMTGGSTPSKELIARWKDQLEYVNGYGPTEGTVFVTKWHYQQGDELPESLPIGKPILNTEHYIMDLGGNLVPFGTIGELCVSSSVALARGYLNRPELTEEKFVINKYNGRKMYRTGDLARWLPDGNLEFFGRIDEQVKIRGYRVELGEIESCLLKQEQIREAVVVVYVNSRKENELAAYFVSDEEVSLDILKENLSSKLPDYMVPSYFVKLDKIPLTTNNKIDRKSLLDPKEYMMRTSKFRSPRSGKEEKLASVWAEVLGHETVGIDDNFFDLGGDSIKAIQILSRSRREDINITVKNIFEYRTIAKIMDSVNINREQQLTNQGEAKGEVILTPIQLWLFESQLKHLQYWNQANMFKLAENVDLQLLEDVIRELIYHHDALRMKYVVQDDQMIQTNRGVNEIKFELEMINLSDLSHDEQKEKMISCTEMIQDQLNMENDLLIRGVVFDLGDQGKRFFISIHHLVVDGVSWRILLEDLENLYQSKLQEKLPLKTTSFKEWGERLYSYAQNSAIDIKYWKNIDLEKIEFLIDGTREKKNDQIKNITIKLEKNKTEQLLTKVHQTYNTEINDILLSALSCSLSDVFDMEAILFTLEGHGREELWEDVDLSRTIGWFTSIFPVYFERQKSIELTIQYVKEELRKIPQRGLNFGIARYLQNDKKLQEINPEITFNYLGQFDGIIQKEKEGLLSGSPERAGRSVHSDNRHLEAMAINGLVVDGQLQLAVTYNGFYIEDVVIEQFKESFVTNLEQIIDHCLARKESTLTASDFGVQHLFEMQGFEQLRVIPSYQNLKNVKKICELAPLQQGFLYQNVANPLDLNYHQQVCYYLEGDVNIELLKFAWEEVVKRYDIFRTNFHWKESLVPVQVVLKNKAAEIYELDLSHLSPEEQIRHNDEYKQRDLQIGFNFSSGKLNRISIIKMSNQKYFICWSFHHILLDGWSVQIVLRDFLTIYRQSTHQLELPDTPKVQMSDFIQWLKRKDIEQGLAYWNEYLQEVSQQTYLSVTLPPSKEEDESVPIVYCGLDKEQTTKIHEFCKKYGITVNVLMETSWGILLQKLNNTDFSCFGMTVSGRPTDLSDMEKIVGLFINTLPVVIQSKGNEKIKDVLTRVNEELLEIREYEYLSLSQIQKMSPIKVTDGLFNTIIVFENYPIQSVFSKNSFDFNVIVDSLHEKSDVDLTLIINNKERISFEFMYNATQFTRDSITWIFEHFTNIINFIVTEIDTDPDVTISAIEWLNTTEKENEIYAFNNTRAEYPGEQTMVQLFENQVAKTPFKIAIEDEIQQISYRELNEKVNQLSKVLREYGVQKNQIVGILAEHSIETVIGILAVLKAGCAYLPIDPDYPEERISYLLDDSGIRVLLTQIHLMEKVSVDGQMIILTDENNYQGDVSNPLVMASPSDLAYIIYTSGSTGQPKGVMIEHQGLVNYTIWAQKVYVKGEEVAFPLYSSLSFDLTVTSIYVPLLSGNKVIIYKKEEHDLLISKIIEDDKVDVIKLTPAHLRIIQELEIHNTRLKRMIVGGEELKTDLAADIYKKWNGNIEIFNEYGPTETVVGCMIHQFDIDKDQDVSVPIGYPADNVQIYLLDANLKPVYSGIPGEIYISGVGVARGYLNRRDLTQQKFVEHPFMPDQKMYRTGDLGRRLHDGRIVYLGRIDSQVKIRGYRIEVGEIEYQLLQHEDIQDSVCLIKDDQTRGKQIYAFIVLKKEMQVENLKHYLAQRLPEYMIPSFFIQVEKIPLTPNGKVNQRALLLIENEGLTGKEFDEPKTPLEKRMAKIWCEVLNVDQVGVNKNFFELGGHSISVISLCARISKEFNIQLDFTDVFQSPTITNLIILLKSKNVKEFVAIEKAEEKDYYQLSSAQKRLYVVNLLSINSTEYNIPTILRIDGEFDLQKMEDAFQKLIERHEALRTSFAQINGKPVQIIHKKVDFHVRHRKILNEELEQVMAEFVQSFDLQKAPLFRVEVLETDQEKVFMVDIHHIIADGVSMNLLIQEFTQLYAGETLPVIKIQYKDFTIWQNDLFETGHLKKQEEYWLNAFADEIPVLDMPADFPRSLALGFDGGTHSFELSKELSDQIKKLNLQYEVTSFMILLAVYNVLLSKYTNQEDIIVGVPIAGRVHADLDNTIGMFANTLAIRTKPNTTKTFSGFLQEVKNVALQAYENQDYQFEMLVNKLNLDRDLTRNPLFDVMLSMEKSNKVKTPLNGVQLSPYSIKNRSAKFDLTLVGVETDDEYYFTLEYRSNLYRKDTIERFVQHFVKIVEIVTADSEIELQNINMLSDEEVQRLVVDFNQTQVDYPKDKTLVQLFEEQAEISSLEMALCFNGQEWTYKNLNQRANQIARYLKNKSVTAESIIGILMERSPEMIAGILGILKAGGAYLPIDPDYPDERITFMLDDCKTSIVITQQHLQKRIPATVTTVFLDQENILEEDKSNLSYIAQPDNLAYIIYTSGSTGVPKGVMIEHRGVVNYVEWAKKMYLKGESASFPLYSSLSFDLTVTSIFVPLLSGNRMVIYGTEESELLIDKILRDDKVEIIKLTPAHLRVLKNLEIKPKKLCRMIVGGEKLETELASEIYQKFDGNIEIYNEYGPTETVVGCMIYKYCPENDLRDSVPIGYPADNVQIYVLDDHLRPVGYGIPGEMYISGDGVARGYLNRAELTGERFIENPFIDGTRLYRTGDWAKHLCDGNIEFLGRKDHQVKIRGYRIELGEVEKRISSYQEIEEVVVLAKEDVHSGQHLRAYYTTHESINTSQLRIYLETVLPEYMIPSFFIEIEKLSFTTNGKIDQTALLQMSPENYKETNFVEPRTRVEKMLAETWKEVIGRDKVSIYDKFFEIGGDSIKAIQLMSKINQKGYKIRLNDFFNHPTIEQLAKVIKYNSPIKTEQGVVSGEVRLSPVQRQTIKTADNINHYSYPVLLQPKERLDSTVMIEALQVLIEHHDALRINYIPEKDIFIQNKEYLEREFILEFHDLSHLSIEEQTDQIAFYGTKLMQSYDIINELMVKAAIFDLGESGQRFLFAPHHLVADPISGKVLIEDLTQIYLSLKQGKKIELPAKTTSFKTWTDALYEYGKSQITEEDRAYWEDIIQIKVSLPIDFDHGPNLWTKMGKVSAHLSKEETELLLAHTNQAYETEINDILLTSLAVTLQKFTGSDETLVELHGHGREDLFDHINLSRTVGWMTMSYPVKLDVRGSNNLERQILTIKEQVHYIRNKGVDYGILNHMSENPLSELNLANVVVFEYMGQYDQEIQQNPLFDFAVEYYGEKVSPNYSKETPITVVGLVIGGQLHITFNYSETKYNQQTIQKVCDEYMTNLKNIIQHCTNMQKVEALES
ncbi:MAG: amino acid adenylation domain-containing protein [Halanaerobiales bacterium]|nr:amino acid adenylation domain-containing protein [Halanaerobiales bacterium]